MKFLRRVKYKLYIRWLALRWVSQINLGDQVLHKGCVRVVNNGVYPNSWTLTDPYEQFVPRSECTKIWTWKNCYGSYKSGVRFYETSWLDIWVNQGIQPWVKALPIWGRNK